MLVPGWVAGAEAGVVSAVSGGFAEWLPEVGATGMLALVVYMVLTGRLVPGKERDYWRQAYFSESEKSAGAIEAGKITQDVLRALEQRAAQKDAAP